MQRSIEKLMLDLPKDYQSLFKEAFPTSRTLIMDDSFKSDSDENIFIRWYKESIKPLVSKSSEEVKASLRYCLDARGAAELALLTSGVDLICNQLPSYPQGTAPAIAALVVLAAHLLRDDGLI